MIEVTRLLGFAFAGADLLFEIDRKGKILFATGATTGIAEDGELVGRQGGELFTVADRGKFLTLVHGMSPGDRIGPLNIALAVGGHAKLAICYLPQNGNRISCTLVRPGQRGSTVPVGTDGETGLADREAFMAAAAASAGSPAGLALVNVRDLPKVVANLGAKEAKALLSHIGATVKKMGAAGAGRVSETGFGVISEDPEAARTLAHQIQSAVRERGIDQLEVEEMLVSLKNRGLTPEQTMLAVRHVVGRFAENKLGENPPPDLAQAFDGLVTETLGRAHALNATVSDGAFDLVFEPIMDLHSNTPSHYEALTRFAPGQSPAETIRFAEELGIADVFDLAVVVKVFGLMEREPSSGAVIAINISGRSISNPTSFAMLAGLLAKKRTLARRILIEITESSELPDMVAADKAIQAMRGMGYRVGIDDFGAGAASLQYLHGFSVDFLKVDGSLIRRIGTSQRDDALLKGVLQTCSDLGIETVAEWIDSPEKLQRCRDIGFMMGQGRYFGGALTEFPKPMMLTNTRPKRLAS
jgi:EAL domain-containing protein (putative c-di-GMP-specific phosphodiesterase class I)/GGDEF domain-containing protein